MAFFLCLTILLKYAVNQRDNENSFVQYYFNLGNMWRIDDFAYCESMTVRKLNSVKTFLSEIQPGQLRKLNFVQPLPDVWDASK